MLLYLDLKHFILIDHLHLELSSGLTTLTGETGAGKSILLDAIGFVLGGKANIDWIPKGQTKTDISAVFVPNTIAYQWVLTHQFITNHPFKDHNKKNTVHSLTDNIHSNPLHIRRILDIKGKSRCTINGLPATLTQLRELSTYLVHIHGQHGHQYLLKSNYQRTVLDEYAHNQSARQAVHLSWNELNIHLNTLNTAKKQATHLLEKREQLAWVFDELSTLQPIEGEWEQLEITHKRLSNQATILNTLQTVLIVLEDSEESLIARTRHLNTTVNHLLKYDPAIDSLIERLDSAYIQLKEAAYSLTNYVNKLDIDTEELIQVESRIANIHSTARKLRLPPTELFNRFNSVQAELKQLDLEQDIITLENTVAIAKHNYDLTARVLSNTRINAAKTLSEKITHTMHTLALPHAQFMVQCSTGSASAQGIDKIEFLVTTNIGQPLRSLVNIASGGELARINLALCVITAHQTIVPTLIFDEVDTGIGGATADIVGQQLRQLGHSTQILAVTHLPQVAANAHHQIKINKTLINNTVVSTVLSLNEKERCQEIARMLGGEHITATTLQHAKELLAIAAQKTPNAI